MYRILAAWLPTLLLLLVSPLPLFAFEKIPEKLVYSLSWTGIPVGTATHEITEEGGLRRINSTARSNDWLSAFFPVDDRTESILDKGGVFPGTTRSFKMLFKEGRSVRDREITFNSTGRSALYHNKTNGEKQIIPIEPRTYDIYSSFYYTRYQPLEPGKSLYINVLDSKKLHRIKIRALRRERIKVPAGEFNTIVIEPMVKPVGVFEGKKGAYIWLTDDDRRIPVKAQTKVKLGSVTAVLTGGNY
ncbi:DUF3108 domain-containing protein [Pelotalea chapellei]|uniref:DUF3108 domain-containing protein n=1 Tax=Pelotalea chapellei TaxID=44671 RepID=A0ABS5U5I1_9BACT|nr:DUF3108 domain-containing protein [Pelotalea chapellei]MBT1070935.1 DUF3108 domain-containing protein [Pelotalea chapellei]